MLPESQVPTVGDDEALARFCTQSNHFRSSDNSVTHIAFTPFPHMALSVSRHLSVTEEELWRIGLAVAQVGSKQLYGRADITVQSCLSQLLRVVAAPVVGNSNHADIVGWPGEKPQQKIIALELAAAAKFVRVPKLGESVN